ncbi:MAG: hypothetical protein JWM80_3750 [Cyanobacteria bacterium RYN_339]|nr:hypothetical protein [Cyanobacteria bacterium RYN_339]
MPFLVGYAGTPDPAFPISPPGLSYLHGKPALRKDLAFATDFVQRLVARGVRVRAVNHSVYNGFFEDTHQAAHLTTPEGVVEVVFFPYDVATQVKVTRSYDAEGGVYVFAVQRHPSDPEPTVIDSPCDMAVMMEGKLFILTDSEKLAKEVRQALHPGT